MINLVGSSRQEELDKGIPYPLIFLFYGGKLLIIYAILKPILENRALELR